MKKIILPVIATAVLTSLLTFWAASKLSQEPAFLKNNNNLPVHYTSGTLNPSTQPVDFAAAATSSVKSVVHIMTLTEGKTVIARDPSDPFGVFGREFRTPNQMGSGSGVIISPDGYIVTNNHVVHGADKVQVTFNDRNTQIAKVIGTDPATDLAIIKIEGKNLPYMTLGNSDDVQLGQWVLAVGYPLNLDCTVTAGIISAKGRSIGINRSRNKNAIESFIQTDAAVNPGNSGGALVNTAGLLVGINSAIASPTGSYAGYAYAIPSNMVQKVANDIIKFGKVERGYLGVQLYDLDKIDIQSAEKLGVSKEDYKNVRGVYVSGIVENSGAEKAGLKKGDFINAINGMPVLSSPELMEQVSRYHPGDKISIGYERNGKNYLTSIELKNLAGTVARNDIQGKDDILGASMRNLSAAEAKKLNLEGGVLINSLHQDGTLQKQTNIKPGFVIFSVNDQVIKNLSELRTAINEAPDGNLQFAGVYPGKNGIYYYGFQNNSGPGN
jgi:Do/DeqQ family serine protease